MSSSFGKNIKVNVFGESHSKAIGVNIDGLPAGIKLDEEKILAAMNRRAPKKDAYSTARKETDVYEIVSGFFNGYTTGTPLCAVIKNKDQHSSDYDELKTKPRPSHADHTGAVRYNGFNDHRGGGHFSGRLTAPLVFAGAVCDQMLEKYGVFVGAHIYSIGNEKDAPFGDDADKALIEKLQSLNFPLIDETKKDNMEKLICDTKTDEDSIGGIVECCVIGLKPGIGNPMFDTIESNIAYALFGIPAVKGVEFGAGFGISKMKGSEANDCPVYENGGIKYKTNKNGGIIGGISNGMPIILRAAIKPTPSIAKRQETVDLEKKQNTELIIKGRHDSCIVPRAVEVIRAAVSITIADMILENKKYV